MYDPPHGIDGWKEKEQDDHVNEKWTDFFDKESFTNFKNIALR